jgi:hypothetical protein
MNDKVFKTADQQEIEKKTHRIWVVFGFTVFLGLLIIGLCVFIYKQDKIYKQVIDQRTKAVEEYKAKQSSYGFTAGELAQVTNIRPLYLVESH